MFLFQDMGKKNKKALEEEPNPIEEENKDEDPADDDALIPYHTKQASFAMLYLLFFSFLMFTLPFASFFATRHVLKEYFHLDNFQITCWSVISTVVTVNLIIALYALFGYIEARKEQETVKQFSKSKSN